MTHNVALIIVSLILLMKMHSYTSENLAQLERHREDSKSSEETKDKNALIYPNNLTIFNYLYFLRIPALVYQLNYPRSEHSWRIGYIIQKILQAILHWFFMYLIVVNDMLPLWDKINNAEIGLLEGFARYICPSGLFCINLFMFIFECCLNIYAETTQFGDRMFYQDWWNSTNLDEFSRKWNKPVHEFLYRHIYLMGIKTLKVIEYRIIYIYIL